jgi:hypothetical protein
MASDGSNKGGLLTAGGILSIIGGALEVIGGGVMAVLIIANRVLFRLPLLPFHPGIWFEHFGAVDLIWLIIVGVPVFALGIVAIIGGVSAIRKKSFGLSLAGAICALPSGILGILAIIFVSLSKKQFGAES